jgi:Uma2 family endonuclease
MQATVRIDQHPISDAELAPVGADNAGWQVERVQGALVISPTGANAGRRNAALTARLFDWASRNGYVAFDSSTGFKVSNDDVLSPDGSLVLGSRWDSLSAEEQSGYAALVPDLVVELLSETDQLRQVREKCARWRSEGARFVVLIDPKTGTVEAAGDDVTRGEIDWREFTQF